MKVLITGGTGLIGKALTKKLISEGHEVNILTRKVTNNTQAKEYLWDQQSIDKKAFDGVEALVHLAGAGIADKRWNAGRKKEIIESRVNSLQLIESLYKSDSLKTIIGGSAVGFYGGDTGEINNNEDSPNGDDFMAECCVLWEKAEDNLAKNLNLRLVKIRTGVVLDKKDGALPTILLPIKYNLGSPIGSGQQWISWIHIDDIVEIFYQSIVNSEIKGIINGVAPHPVRNETLTKTAAHILDKWSFLPNVPSILLKAILGEMSVVVLGSSKVENKRKLPFKLKYNHIEDALKNLLL